MFRGSKILLFVLSVALVVAGCAAEHYKPEPVNASLSAKQLESRSLDDPALGHFIEKSLGHRLASWPLPQWNLETLTLAAFYFNPQLEVARAQAQAASAAVITAGARPNPTLSLAPGIPSPYLFGLTFAIPIETHGKRGIRIREARDLDNASRIALAIAAWKVRSKVRTALVDLFVAQNRRKLLEAQDQLLAKKVALLDERLAVGEIPRPAVDQARVARLNTALQVQAARGQIRVARAALAAAIGIPVAGLGGARLSIHDFAELPAPDSLPSKTIERDAVLDRLDVRRALIEYAAAEEALRLEIARQYPNVSIGPGYQYEESNNYFTLGLSSVLPIFNRNQGPIAQAEARRKQAAANFLSVQAQGIAQSESALAAYRSAFRELQQAETSFGELQGRRETMQRQSVRAGESNRLALNVVLLEGSAASFVELGALAEAQAAFGALENAVERPLGTETLPELSPAALAAKNRAKGVKP